MIKLKKLRNLLKQQVLIIMIGTLLSKFLGLIRDIVLAKYYGATIITDSYIIATLIPSILVGILATAILSTYIPVLNEEQKKGKGQYFTNNFVNICIILVTIVIGVYFIFNRQIVSLFVIGFDGENLNTIINMTNITIFVSYSLVVISIYSGYLQSKNKFIATSFYGLIFNIISILGICISRNIDYKIMPIMFVVGYSISLLILILNCIKCGYKYSLICDFKDNAIKKVFLLTLPVLFNSIVWDINVVIDKSLISTVGEGYVSALNYSYKIINVVINVIATSIAVYIFPKIIELFEKKENENANKVVTKSLILMFILIVPITTFMIYFAEPIVKILFMRGNFDDNALQVTQTSLKIYAISIIPIGINTILYKVFNAMKKNKIPATNAIISIVINIILNVILIKLFSYKGIILATGISNIVATILIIIRTRQQNIKIQYKEIIIFLIKIIIAMLIALLVSIYVYKKLLLNSELLKILIIVTIYFIIYCIIMLLEKIKISEIKM